MGELLTGTLTPGEQQPDADLGKSLREGFRNTTRAGDENRSFGIPTIRTDVRLPKLRSVANTQVGEGAVLGSGAGVVVMGTHPIAHTVVLGWAAVLGPCHANGGCGTTTRCFAGGIRATGGHGTEGLSCCPR